MKVCKTMSSQQVGSSYRHVYDESNNDKYIFLHCIQTSHFLTPGVPDLILSNNYILVCLPKQGDNPLVSVN